MRLFPLLVPAALLLGCAGPDWVRPGASEEANAAARVACENAADREYVAGYAAERAGAYEGGLQPQATPLAGLPRRYGRGDLFENEDASRRLDRDMNRTVTTAARGQAFDRCMEASGFTLAPPRS